MTQFARPDLTVDNANWLPVPSGNEHLRIDEVTLDTADYIYSTTISAIEFTLSNVTDPSSSSGHVIHVVREQAGTVTTPIVRLYQGSSDGTLIVQRTLPSGAQSEFTYTLSAGEANAITDYTDLSMVFIREGGGGTYTIYQAFLEVPDLGTTIVGSRFQKAPTFPQGTVAGGSANLTGNVFARAASFPRGWIGKPSYMPAAVVEMDTSELSNGAALDAGFTLDSGATLDYSELTWTEDLTPYLRRGTVDRGTDQELQRVGAGTGELTFDNRTGVLTGVPSMRRFRIQAVWEGVFYPVISGFAESLEITFPGHGDQEMTVTLVDGFAILAAAPISGDFPQQSSGDRVTAILEAAGWPATFSSVDQGVADIPAMTLEDVPALEHIQQVEFAEGGRFFMSRDGVATFRDRFAPSPDLSERTWADDGTGMSYRDLAAPRSNTLIMNLVKFTRPGGVEQIAESVFSRKRYGVRPFVQEVLLATDAEALELAEIFRDRYSDPERRIESLVDNAMRHREWTRVLEREIADTVKVIESEIPLSQVSALEGISHEFDFQVDWWTVTLRVSPRSVSVHAILDDPVLGVLDAGNVLG